MTTEPPTKSAKKRQADYFVLVPCSCRKTKGGKGIMLTAEGNPVPCPYCQYSGEPGKRQENRPHPTHKMTRWRSEILAPAGTPRFYGVRECRNCRKEEWRHAAGHFLHGLGQPCEVKP